MCSNQYEGIDPISLVDKAAILYKEDIENTEPIKMWQFVLKNEPDTSYAFGMSANNLHEHYTFKKNIKKSEDLFNRIVKSNMSDEYLTSNIMEPNTNYRYNACIRMFQMYASIAEFEKAMSYLHLAQNKYKYITTSMSSYKQKLVENEIWNSRLHFDLGDTIKAKNILINAGLNSDYYYHDKWSSFSNVKHEMRIGTELIQLMKDNELTDLIISIEKGIHNLKIEDEDETKYQVIVIDSSVYKIPLYREIELDSCKKLMKKLFLLEQLREEIKKESLNNG